MIFLGSYTAGAVLPYAVRFHSDLGTAEDPTGVGAKLRDAAGTWQAQTAPAKLDSTTGLYGGTVATTGLVDGLYLLHVYGTVTTGKTVGTVVSFTISSVDAAIKAKTDTIGALAVTVSSPVAASGDISLYSGDDYAAAHGRTLTFTVADPTHALGLTDALVELWLKCSQASWMHDSVTLTTPGYTVAFALTAAETAAITLTRQNYELEATLADGDVVTLARGTLVAVADIPAIPAVP